MEWTGMYNSIHLVRAFSAGTITGNIVLPLCENFVDRVSSQALTLHCGWWMYGIMFISFQGLNNAV